MCYRHDQIFVPIRCQSTSIRPLPHLTSSRLEKWPSPTQQRTHPVTKPAALSTLRSSVSPLQIMWVLYKKQPLYSSVSSAQVLPPGLETLQDPLSLKPYISRLLLARWALWKVPDGCYLSLLTWHLFSKSFKPRLFMPFDCIVAKVTNNLCCDSYLLFLWSPLRPVTGCWTSESLSC